MSKTKDEQCCNGDVLLKLRSALYNLRRRYNHREIEDFKKRLNALIRFKLGFGKYFYWQGANIPDLTFSETELLFFFSFFDSCMLHIEIFVANRRPSEIFVSLGHFQVLEVWFDPINEKRTTVPKRTDTLYRDWVSV